MVNKVLILASGEGSNAEAIMDYCSKNRERMEVLALISDRKEARALERAKKFNIPSYFISHEEKDKLISTVQALSVDWVCLAGYMRLVPKEFIELFTSKCGRFYQVLNIHPSLLPAFPGLNGYKQAFDFGVKVSGVTIHLVDEFLDSGPIILQKTFERKDDDSFENFYKRGKSIENELYREVLDAIAWGRLFLKETTVEGRLFFGIRKK